MGNASWHDLVIRAARSIPPIARLHDDRNALADKLAALQARNAAADAARSGQPEAARPELLFDYPYAPRVRSWDNMRG